MGTVKQEIARRIKEARLERGWTQKDLAKRLGTTNASVSRWENPERDFPKDENLRKLADVFDDPELLMVGDLRREVVDEKHKQRLREAVTDVALEKGESLQIDGHVIELLPDGSLLVNDSIRVQAP